LLHLLGVDHKPDVLFQMTATCDSRMWPEN
jgi:hypothetical protein